jgi:hypothetical protein
LDVLAHSGLGDLQAHRRFAEAHLIGCSDKGLDLMKSDHPAQPLFPGNDMRRSGTGIVNGRASAIQISYSDVFNHQYKPGQW